jgi:hypothetical protein
MTKKDTTQFTFEETLALQLSKLPEDYVTALLSDKADQKIHNFLASQDITDLDIKDDILMLLIGIESYDLFVSVLVNSYDITKTQAMQVRDFVNKDLYRTVVEQMPEDSDEEATAGMPVPPPPGGAGGAPAPSYGGTSDPYREPTDN